MEYSQSKNLDLNLNKEALIDLLDNCLRTLVFKGIQIEPSFEAIVSKDLQLDMDNLSQEEFNNEILQDTKFDSISLVILTRINGLQQSFVLTEDNAFNHTVFRLTSPNKIWVDNNLKIIEDFLKKYEIKIKPQILENTTKDVLQKNLNITTNNKNIKKSWSRNDVIAGIAVIVSAVGVLIACLTYIKS